MRTRRAMVRARSSLSRRQELRRLPRWQRLHPPEGLGGGVTACPGSTPGQRHRMPRSRPIRLRGGRHRLKATVAAGRAHVVRNPIAVQTELHSATAPRAAPDAGGHPEQGGRPCPGGDLRPGEHRDGLGNCWRPRSPLRGRRRRVTRLWRGGGSWSGRFQPKTNPRRVISSSCRAARSAPPCSRNRSMACSAAQQE